MVSGDSRIDNIITKYGYNLDDRPSHSVHYCCPSCEAFYSENTAPDFDFVWNEDSDKFRSEYYCNCHNKSTRLVDCHEVNSNSPAMIWEVEKLKLIQYKLEDELAVVSKELKYYES